VKRKKIGQHFITYSNLNFQLHKLPIYRLKDDLSCKFLKNSPIRAWQVASHEWRGSSPLRECHVANITCKLSFEYSPMRGGQVAKEVKRKSSHEAPTWSCMWGHLGLIFLRWHLLGVFFQRWMSTFSYGLQGPKSYFTWPKINSTLFYTIFTTKGLLILKL